MRELLNPRRAFAAAFPTVMPTAKVCRRRPRAFVYMPLVMHLAPTLVIGYAIVIPPSCIAGVNAETVGFAATGAGFAAAYAPGVRLARRQGPRPHA
jgi:hypothetical protein